MKKILCLLLFTFVSFVAFAKLTGNEIVEKSDDLMDRTHSISKVEMKVYRKNKLRKKYRMTMKNAGSEKMLIEFTYPPRNKGEKVLQVGDNIWIYRPKINKIIRISGKSSFSGSDFSNTDILSVRLSKDYNAKIIGEEDFQGKKAYKLELLAKSDDVTYAKIIYWVRKSDLVPLKRDFYTLSGHRIKTLLLETRDGGMNGNGLPNYMIMSNVMEKNKKSIMIFKSFQGNQKFSDKVFRKSSLKRRR